MEKILQHFVILLTSASVIMGISTVAMLMPQAAYASTDEITDEDCGSDELPAIIDEVIVCIKHGECFFSETEARGEQVKHCNFMMDSDE
jgi:hypothetical protein